MAKQKDAYCKNFKSPDEIREFQDHGRLEVLNFFDGSGIGHGVFQPGWKWSTDVKPLAGTSSCQAEHLGYCISGSMIIRMNNGDEFKIQAGDAFTIPPGHDAWVDSNGPCELIDVTGYKTYAKKAAA
jgi:mannose-6-phosphate isomerase-like protein (cupin superfamily)